MLSLADIPPPDPTLPEPPTSVIQQVAIKSLSIWHAIIGGAVTGFAIALGTMLFTKGARRFGIEPLHGPREDKAMARRSLTEERKAIRDYRKRSKATDDPNLRKIFRHTMREEQTHARHLRSWIRGHQR